MDTPGRLNTAIVRSLLGCALILALLYAQAAFAQRGLLPLSSEPSASLATEPFVNRREEIVRLLAGAQDARRALGVSEVRDAAASELERQHERLISLLEDQLKLLDDSDIERERTAYEQEFAVLVKRLGGAPHSVLAVDAARERLEAINEQTTLLSQQVDSLNLEASRLLERKKRTEEELRRANERVLTEGGDPLRAAELGAMSRIVEIRLQVADAELAQAHLTREGATNRRDVARSFALRLEQVVIEASKSEQFSEGDLESVRARFARSLEELAQAAANHEVAAGKRQKAREREAKRSAPDPDRMRALEVAVEADRVVSQMIEGLVSIERLSQSAWEQRFEAMNGGPEVRTAALASLRSMREALAARDSYSRDVVETARAAWRDQQTRVRANPDAASADREGEILAALYARLTYVERATSAAAELNRAITRWLASLSASTGTVPRAKEGLSELARQIWDFELLAVDDVTEVNGQRIKVSYGVTVGKSIGALLLFVVGYWLFSLLTAALSRLLIHRFGRSPNAANLIRRWLGIGFAIVLLIVVLNLARIPLTVFAFLGGALAIGVGFGTQTIIRNLISGIIILFECKIRVGDIVQLQDMTGHVVAIDLRASTVRAFDGVEALVPNSVLLENQIVNWTYSSPRVRRTIKVGVAYGSPVREAAAIIERCARDNPDVLADPAPEALLEDFGDNALVLSLYLWAEIGKGRSMVQIDSEIRFAIEEALGRAGISIAFPQRDLHVDVVKPITVRWADGGTL